MMITIDGPSGTGKSTVARRVADRLGLTFFDTGAMYRSVTWHFLKRRVELQDLQQVRSALDTFVYSKRKIGGKDHHFVSETDVTDAIRLQEITSAVSATSAHPEVRKAIWTLQRAVARGKGSIFEGRDMGSIVFPDAEVKIYLDADPEVRARRRLEQMRREWSEEAGPLDLDTVQRELNRRDQFDQSRELAPLVCPKGALRIDTSQLAIDQVVQRIVSQYCTYSKGLYPSWLKTKAMRPLYRIVLCLATGLFHLLYRHKVYGLEHCIEGAAIIAPNHTSFWDPPLAAVSWPGELHFLARESLFDNPMFGSFIRRLNAHPVGENATNVAVLKTLIGLLRQDKQLLLFAEGTRTDGQLGAIKPGIGMLAMRSGAAIIPTYIFGASRIWDRKKRFPKFLGKTAVIFGSPISADAFSGADKKEVQMAMSRKLRTSILALKRWYESGAEGIPP